MKIMVYKYENPGKQTSTFRGYVKQYREAEAIITTCPVVRTNEAAAMRDAKNLMKKLQHGVNK